MSQINRNLRGWIILIFSILAVFIALPYVFWINHKHSLNLKERGKHGEAKVVSVKGFKEDKVCFKYEVNGVKIEKHREAPSNHKIKVGDTLKIIYDSLDIETVKVIW